MASLATSLFSPGGLVPLPGIWTRKCEGDGFPSMSRQSERLKRVGQTVSQFGRQHTTKFPHSISMSLSTPAASRFSALRCSAAATEAKTIQRKSASSTISRDRTGVTKTPKIDDGGPGLPPFFRGGGGGGGGGDGSNSSGGFILFLVLMFLDYLKEREKEQSNKQGSHYDYST